MTGFITALLRPEFPFIRNALLTGLLSSVLFGIQGSIVTVRRIASLAGAVFHAVLGGIGMALYLQASRIAPDFPPIAGAFVFAVVSALIIGIVSLKTKQREDTMINAILSPAGTSSSWPPWTGLCCFWLGAFTPYRSLGRMMLGSSVCSALFSAGGLTLGWTFDAPAGAMVVIPEGSIFLIVAGLKVLRRLSA
jgi:ABC-type Mn2+/Zn2+ transport system permease subunit